MKINRFEFMLRKYCSSLGNKRSSNLTMAQKSRLSYIRNKKEFQVLLVDKDLEPMVASRDNIVIYIAGQYFSDRKHMR